MFDVDVAISAANVSSLINTGRAYSGVERKYNWYLYYDICEIWLRAYYTTDFPLATHWKLVTSNSLSGHGKPERAYRDRNSHYSDKTLLSSWWKSSTREDAIYSETRPWSLHSFDLLYNSAYTAQLNCSKVCGIFFGNSYRYFQQICAYLFIHFTKNNMKRYLEISSIPLTCCIILAQRMSPVPNSSTQCRSYPVYQTLGSGFSIW